jgi:2-(1,2-epoxy-1,2-dihydrophenyl)acetyl-CoA isomerase
MQELSREPWKICEATRMTNQTIVMTTSGGVMKITLNRPDKLNSFNEDMSRMLQSALSQARTPEIRVVLLTGAGKGFCAGQDLSDGVTGKAGAKPDLGHTVETVWNPIVRAIRDLAKPVVCAVNGVAAGAGANVALSCDIVVVARSARFIQPFHRLGLVPDSGGTYHLPRLIGEARAKGVTMLGMTLSAEQAMAWGLVWDVVDDTELMTHADALANDLAAAPTYALGLIKHAIHASATNTLDQQLDLERDLQRKAGHTTDFAEGLGAFLEKRQPQFDGLAP